MRAFGKYIHRRRRSLGSLLWLGALSVAASVAGGEKTSEEMGGFFGNLGLTDELQIDGGVYDFLKDRKMVLIRNYAVVRVRDATIRARNITYAIESSEVYAEGDVTFEHGSSGSRFDCDRLFIRTSDWHGLVENMRVKASREPPPKRAFLDEPALGPGSRRASSMAEASHISRMVATAREVRALGLDHQEMIGGAITPSLFAKPHWSVQSAAVNVRPKNKVESWHNVLRIGKVPVFYFPYIIKDLRYDWPWLRFGAGHSSDWGFYTLLKYGIDLNPQPTQTFRPGEIFFDLDWRQERGWGLGGELNYQVGKGKSFGRLDAYWVKETAIDRDDDLERALEKNDTSIYINEPNFAPDLYRDEDRWSLEWWHRQQFTQRWDLRMEAHKYSDRDFRREYFERDYKENKEPETAFDLRYQHENWQFELFARKRLNAWENQSEYLPEARITIPGFRLGQLPLYIVSDTRVGWIDRRYDEALDKYGYLEGQKDISAEIRKIKAGDNYGLFFRAHEDLRLQAPIHLGDLFVFTPWIGSRATYYEEQFGEWVPDNLLTATALAERRAGRWHDSFVRGDTGSETNTAFLWGADLSTRLYGLFDGGNWRHILEPTISFTAGEDPHVSPDRLYYIDEVDTYDEHHYFTFALRNKFQTRRAGQVVDVMDFGLKMRYYPQDDEQDEYNYGRAATEMEVDFAWRPTDRLTFWGNGLLDTDDGKINRLYAGADWRLGDLFRAYVQHAHYRGHYWHYPTADELNQTTFALRTRLWNKDSKYAVEAAFTYDWEDNPSSFDGFSEERYTLIRDLDTFELGISFVHDRKDDDKGIYVTLTPTGWANIERESSALESASRLPEEMGRYDRLEEPERPPDAPLQSEIKPLTGKSAAGQSEKQEP